MTKGTKALAICAFALICAGAVLAQEQVGAIEGKVWADDGTALPGVTVEAKGPIGTLVTVTDASGGFRFPRTAIGSYTVKASLEGFVTGEAQEIRVALGTTATVAFRLQPSTVFESITVLAETTGIDLLSSATATSIGDEQIELIPSGRDFTDLVDQALGAGNEAFLGGISIDGASGAENRFVIDGIDTTHPNSGLSGQSLIPDFIDEVQVKSAGYAAEYGGAVGGVISAITKTGTNERRGWVGGYYTDASWEGSERPTRYESDPSLYRTFAKDDAAVFEPGFALGGPIVKDKAWFYVGYMPRTTDIDRTPDGSSTSYHQRITRQYATGNIQGNVGSKFLYKVAANLNPSKDEGVLPAKDGTTSADADLSVVNEYPSESYSLYGDYIPSNHLLLSGRAGYFSTDQSTRGVDTDYWVYFQAGLIPVDPSDPLYRPTPWRSIPRGSNWSIDWDLWERKAAALDGTFYFTVGGDHALKLGAQYEKIQNDVSGGDVGELFWFRWGLPDRFRTGTIGTYGSLGVSRYRTEGAVGSVNLGLFLQDSWKVQPNLTLNVGIRTEQERVPNYGVARDPSLPKNAVEFDFRDKLAPRVGFAWDLLGDQRYKLYGSYGHYYDIVKLSLSRGFGGADHWVESIYPVNSVDWQALVQGCTTIHNERTQNPCPHLGIPVNVDRRPPRDPTDAIDPDLEPMEQREFQLGLDHQLTPETILGVRYVNKHLVNTIEDIGYEIESGSALDWVYKFGNPGKGIVAGDPPGPVPVHVEAVRDYQALALTASRRFDGRWSLRASYTYSELTGNYSGLASSDEFGRTDPYIERYFDGVVYGYDQNGQVVEGKLNTDRPHAVEIQALYRAPWGTNLGVSTSWRSGTPITYTGYYAGVQFWPQGRLTHGRTASLSQTDLLITHPFRIGDYSLEVSVNILNLFDEDTVTRLGNDRWYEDLCEVAPACDYTTEWFFSNVPLDYDGIMAANGATPWEYWLQPLAWQAPRTIRLGVKFLF